MIAQLVELGMDVHRSTGASRIVLGVVGGGKVDPRLIELMAGVHEVVRITQPYKLASRTFKPEDTIITIGDVRIGGDEVIVIAGPCSAESEAQVNATAAAVKRAGAKILRGGAFKPRSSPYSFQGMGEDGLQLLRDGSNAHDLKLVTEVMDANQIEVIGKYADIYQVGARNMQNFTLLRELGRTRKPILLKRGIAATMEEWLLSAEYILAGGNTDVILCERGIRTFETFTRNTLDLSAIPIVKELSHLPIFVDPEPRHGPPRQGGADGARRGCRRRRRTDHRGALRSRSRDERRRAVDVPGAVRSADGGAAHHRAGHRPQHLPRAGRAPRMGQVSRCRVPVPGAECRSGSMPDITQGLAIVGPGLIGTSVALAARRRWPHLIVRTVDEDQPLTASARRRRHRAGRAGRRDSRHRFRESAGVIDPARARHRHRQHQATRS